MAALLRQLQKDFLDKPQPNQFVSDKAESPNTGAALIAEILLKRLNPSLYESGKALSFFPIRELSLLHLLYTFVFPDGSSCSFPALLELFR